MTTKFQLLSCNVALAGDILNVVARHAFAPVTFPEMIALKFIHGQAAVTEIFDVGYVERDEDAERARLTSTYSADVIDKIFPGAASRIPQGDTRFKPRLVGTVANPEVPAAADVPMPDATVRLGETGSFDNATTDEVKAPPPAPAAVMVVPDPVPETPVSRRPVPVGG